MRDQYVWVLEIGIYHATLPKISKWEVWQSFNTRSEAVAERDKPSSSKFRVSRRARRAMFRIVKYVPEATR